jgi:hypothetical protein
MFLAFWTGRGVSMARLEKLGGNMKALDVQSRLEFARAGASVLRALALLKTTLRYADFATAIGLKRESDRWEVWHRQQVSDILNLISATERDAGKKKGSVPLQYELVVTESGSPSCWRSFRQQNRNEPVEQEVSNFKLKQCRPASYSPASSKTALKVARQILGGVVRGYHAATTATSSLNAAP